MKDSFFFNFPKFITNESFSCCMDRTVHILSIVLPFIFNRFTRSTYRKTVSMNINEHFTKHQMWINLIISNLSGGINRNIFENTWVVAFFFGQNNTVCHYRNNCYYKIQFHIMVLRGGFRQIDVIFNRLNRSCTLVTWIINNQLRDFRRYTFANIR